MQIDIDGRLLSHAKSSFARGFRFRAPSFLRLGLLGEEDFVVHTPEDFANAAPSHLRDQATSPSPMLSRNAVLETLGM